MKQYTGLTVNVARSIKSRPDDINEEQVYAELNILVSETKYELSNARDIVRTRQVDEVEIMITASSARDMAKALEDVADRMDEVEQIEKERDKAYEDWMKED